MSARVRFLVNHAAASFGVDVPAGGIIGRSALVTLRLDDPRVSEAHALVSLREGRLRMLALRRRFSFEGRAHDDLQLAVGQVIELAPNLELEVLAIDLPSHVPILVSTEGLRQLLPETAFFAVDPPYVTANWRPDAVAVMWASDGTYRLRFNNGDERVVDVSAGPVSFDIGRVFTLQLERTENVAGTSTLREEPVRVVIDGERVELLSSTHGATFDGVGARLLTVLANTSGSLDWATLAQTVWPDEPNWDNLRRRLDVTLSRLRRKLRESGLTPDIVRSEGQGHFSLAATR